MRLIDANKAIDILCKNCGVVPEKSIEKCRIESSDGWCKEYYLLKNLPTVDAIPIEYIRKWVLAQGYGRKQGWFITLRNFEKLIKDWEADNETD